MDNQELVIYPDEFKESVLKVYPKFSNYLMQKMAECRNIRAFLHVWLCDPSWDMILNAKSLKEIQEIAKIEQERHDVYKAFCELYFAQHPSDTNNTTTP